MKGSAIEWCDHTFNPWIGCTKVSPGCERCYAESQDKRRKWTPAGWGKGKPRRRTQTWGEPVKWNKEAEAAGVRARVFCASLADWLDDEVPVEWLADLLQLIHETPELDWLLLTKRPGNWAERVGAALSVRCASSPRIERGYWRFLEGWLQGHSPGNVWVGTTVEDQKRADERVPLLLEIPAVCRFLSCEPLLEEVELRSILNQAGTHYALDCLGGRSSGIHWVIAGGESGAGARAMSEQWASSLRFQCEASAVAFFMKQMGGYPNKRGELAEMPETLRVREVPVVAR